MKTFVAALFMIAAVSNARPASDPAAPQSHFAELGDMKIHYTNYGAADTTVVFVHGWACDETVWSEQAHALAEQAVRVITIDLPGHGQSDKPDINYTMHLYARAIDAVLRDSKVKRAVIVGHSNGVTAVRQFFREYPGSVSALVLVEGGLRPFVDAAQMEKFVEPLRGPDYPKVAGGFIDSMTKPIADEKLRAKIKSLVLRTPQHVAVSEFEAMADPENWGHDSIDVPVLMILARQPIWTPEYENFVRGLVGNLDYQVWDNVSHFLMLEKPREFNDALMKFLHANLLLPEPV